MAEIVTWAVAKQQIWSAWFKTTPGKIRVDFLAFSEIDLEPVRKLLAEDPTFLGITQDGEELEVAA